MFKWIKRIIYGLASICMVVNAQQISYSSGFGCVIQKYDPLIGSNLKCFGEITTLQNSNNLYNIPQETNFTQISCANLRCCGILTNNSISCLGQGYNPNDQYEDNSNTNDLFSIHDFYLNVSPKVFSKCLPSVLFTIFMSICRPNSRSMLVTSLSGMPQGTMCLNMVKSVFTLSARPCIET